VRRQKENSNRPFDWEDEAPTEPQFRRVREGVPPSGRNLPGMPLEMADPDGEDNYRSGGRRFRSQQNPWWRPESTLGRVFLGVGVLIVLASLVTITLMFKTFLSRDARFRIAGAGNIEAAGLTQVSRAEMLPVFGEDIGRNVFFVPLRERRKQLEEIPWVERATVMRVLPDQIRVNVVERKPVAFTREGQQIGLVDASGVLLSMPAATMAQKHYSFPVVTGIDPGDPLASRSARMAVYLRLLAELDGSNQHLSEQISEIDLTDAEDARVLMPEQGADILAHFGEDHFLERYQRFQAHIAEWRQQYPNLAAVDLRYEQQVVLEMAHGKNAVEPTAGAEAALDTSDTKPSAGAPEEKGASEPITTRSSAPKKTAPPKSNAAKSRAAKDKAAKERASKEKAIRDLTAKDKAAKKKREADQRAAINGNKSNAPATRPAEVTGQGQ